MYLAVEGRFIRREILPLFLATEADVDEHDPDAIVMSTGRNNKSKST